MYLGYIPPEPNPAVEQRVRRELKKLDEHLDIKWQPNWVYNEKHDVLEGRYVLICHWPYTDKRRTAWEIHQGETYDILGAFTEDVANPSSVPADPEAVLNLVIERLGQMDGERYPHLQRMRDIQEHNRRQHEKVKEQVLSDAEAIAAEEYIHVATKSFGGI